MQRLEGIAKDTLKARALPQQKTEAVDSCSYSVTTRDKILKPRQEQERALKREQERGRSGGRSIEF